MSTEKLTTSTSMPKCFIESLREMNPASIWAPFFINPAIALMDSYRLKPFPCTIACENIVSALLKQANDEIMVEFDWLAETFPECQRIFQTLQREAIVEYAAVAAAFLIVTNLAQGNITEVTMRGSKADYFLDGRRYLLEISGTENAEHLTSRHSEKVRQLLANPFGKDGYVFVCCFSNQRAKFSFHHLERA
ncbi:hypothetical protein L0337_02690 [candidate division KSB1 bacterium]|nr:hypothetical protein [candidate division KSB1 bacterium]